MPYADADAQRAYQRDWIARRRQEWIAENGPCVDCGSWDQLQVDHRDPTQKISHRIWSWSAVRRSVELLKCVARCEPCHLAKTLRQRAEIPASLPRGQANHMSKVSDEQASEIRNRAAAGVKRKTLAEEFGMSYSGIGHIIRGRTR